MPPSFPSDPTSPQLVLHEIHLIVTKMPTDSVQQPTYSAHYTSTDQQPLIPDSLPDSASYPQQPQINTTAQLNLCVLQRHHPTITSILATASHSQVYLFDPASQSWQKQPICGPLFVVECRRRRRSSDAPPPSHSYAVAILNRSSLENFCMPLWGRGSCEVAGEYVIVAEEEDGEGSVPARAYGLWIHPGADADAAHNVRTLVASTILECAAEAEDVQQPFSEPAEPKNGATTDAMLQSQYHHGQVISVADLFGSGP